MSVGIWGAARRVLVFFERLRWSWLTATHRSDEFSTGFASVDAAWCRHLLLRCLRSLGTVLARQEQDPRPAALALDVVHLSLIHI